MWSRSHTPRGQGHKKIRGQGQEQPYRGQTLSRPRTGMLEAKDQGYNALQKQKSLQKKFLGDLKNEKGLQKKFLGDLQKKNCFLKKILALHTLLTPQKTVLSSSRGQGNFRGLEASRPRTSKCVLEDSISDRYSNHVIKNRLFYTVPCMSLHLSFLIFVLFS